MAKQPTHRTWYVEIQPDSIQIRVSYQRLGKHIQRFTVQLEIWCAEKWHPVIRYDNAHGYCHRDTIHPDGSQDKTSVYIGTVNETFTAAMDDLRAHWESHCDRYLKESKP